MTVMDRLSSVRDRFALADLTVLEAPGAVTVIVKFGVAISSETVVFAEEFVFGRFPGWCWTRRFSLLSSTTCVFEDAERFSLPPSDVELELCSFNFLDDLSGS